MRFLSACLLVSATWSPALAQKSALPADAPAQAQQRYRIAVELYRDKEYADAAREFRIAFKLYPSSPRLAYNLARCLERSDQPAEAVEIYRRYLELAPKAEDRAQVEGYIAGRPKLACHLAPDPSRPAALGRLRIRGVCARRPALPDGRLERDLASQFRPAS